MTSRIDHIVVERVPLDQLHPDPANAKLHDQRNIDVIAGSLQEHGQYIPLIAQTSTGRILKGNGTYAAMKQIGWTEADVVWFDCDDLQATRLALVDNRSSELGEWDEKTLLALLEQAGDIGSLGWNQDEFGILLDSVEIPIEGNDAQDPGPQEDKASELQVKWQTALGQLWLIPSKSMPGRCHRLLIGDSTKADDARRLMAGEKAALFSTDPPYLVDYTGDDRPHQGKDWSNLYREVTIEDKDQFLRTVFTVWSYHLVDNAAWFIWHASSTQGLFERALDECDVHVHEQIIWVKPKATQSFSVYAFQHEPCFFGWRTGHKPYTVDGFFSSHENGHTTVWCADWEGKLASVGNAHPTQKPVALFAIPMRNHTRPGDVCAEPFAGSGSQFVAGEQLGRLVYGCELEPCFGAVILERLAGMWLKPELSETALSASSPKTT